MLVVVLIHHDDVSVTVNLIYFQPDSLRVTLPQAVTAFLVDHAIAVSRLRHRLAQLEIVTVPVIRRLPPLAVTRNPGPGRYRRRGAGSD